MGTSAFILTKRQTYTPEKLLSDSIIAAFHSNSKLYFDNYKKYADEKFLYTTLTISDKLLGAEDIQQFIFYIDGLDNYEIVYDNDDHLDGLDSKLSLYQVGCIEEIYGVQELVFNFVYEYLKLNPEDYFWISDYDWVYSWEDMKRLKSLPYDPKWCYKNPKV